MRIPALHVKKVVLSTLVMFCGEFIVVPMAMLNLSRIFIVDLAMQIRQEGLGRCRCIFSQRPSAV